MNGGHWEPIRNGALLVLLEDWQQVLHHKDYPSLPHAAMFKMVGWRGSPGAPAEGTWECQRVAQCGLLRTMCSVHP